MPDKLSEAMLLRGALDKSIEELQQKNPAPFDDLCKQLAVMDKDGQAEFPEFKKGKNYWIDETLQKRDVFMEGLMERGDVVSYNAPSKARKTFDGGICLSLCLAGGIPWHGIQIPKKLRVGYINFELRERNFRSRVRKVVKSLEKEGFDVNDMDNLMAFHLKGIMIDTESAMIYFRKIIQEHKIDILMIDPFYKFLNSRDRKGLDENSTGDMEYIITRLNALTTCATQGCTIYWLDHYTKSNRSNLKAMDRMAGSGVKAREPDCIMSMTELKSDSDEEEVDSCPDNFRLEFTLRDFAPRPPIGLTWDFPMYRVNDSLNDQKLAGEAGRPKVKLSYDKLVERFNALRDGSTTVPIEETGIGRATLYGIIADAKKSDSNTYDFKIIKRNLIGKAPYKSSPKTEQEKNIEFKLEDF